MHWNGTGTIMENQFTCIGQVLAQLPAPNLGFYCGISIYALFCFSSVCTGQALALLVKLINSRFGHHKGIPIS